MDAVAEASTSNGLGYTSATPGNAGKVAKKEDELEVRMEFGQVPSPLLLALVAAAPLIDSGGLHLLFSQQPKHTAYIPKDTDGRPADMKALIVWMRKNILSEREDMFCEGDSV